MDTTTSSGPDIQERALELIAALGEHIGDVDALTTTVGRAMDRHRRDGPTLVAWALITVFTDYVRLDPDA